MAPQSGAKNPIHNNSVDFHGQFDESVAQMFKNPEYADIEITIGDAKVPAHRFVLCLRSKYFAEALNESFMEGSMKTLKCQSRNEQAYVRVLQYLYTGGYGEEPSSLIVTDDDHELLKDPRVYFLADSFFLDNLKAFALNNFIRKLDELWVSERLVECISEIYANTPSENNDKMRAAVVQTCVKHIKRLLSKQVFAALVQEAGDFAVDLVRALAAERNNYE